MGFNLYISYNEPNCTQKRMVKNRHCNKFQNFTLTLTKKNIVSVLQYFQCKHVKCCYLGSFPCTQMSCYIQENRFNGSGIIIVREQVALGTTYISTLFTFDYMYHFSKANIGVWGRDTYIHTPIPNIGVWGCCPDYSIWDGISFFIHSKLDLEYWMSAR